MKKFTVAILGCGSRGLVYSELINTKEEFEITVLCDVEKPQIDKVKNILNIDVPEFTDVKEFFKEKRADVIVISTPDREHVPQVIKALNLGYDVLVEKPLTDSLKEIKALKKAQKKTGKKVMVCHVLRYGPGFVKCAELLKSGIIGKLYSIDASERVVYWHWAQAYVRGIGAYLKDSHPAILAKCCHDLDLLQYYADSKCKSVSSVGDLLFFTPENAPDGSADRCTDCKYIDSCTYSAKKIYVDNWHKDNKPSFIWPYNKITLQNPLTEDAIYEGIRTSEYGRCAFKCNTEKVDHQLVQMDFENGVKASLKMIYAAEPGRYIVFYGTDGEIIFDERDATITVMPYGKEKYVIDVGILNGIGQSHGGGDAGLINDLYDMLIGKKECVTSLDKSLESHLMGIAAEKSRKLHGKLIKVH